VTEEELLKLTQHIQDKWAADRLNAVGAAGYSAYDPDIGKSVSYSKHDMMRQERETYQRLHQETQKAKEALCRDLMGDSRYAALTEPADALKFWGATRDAITGPARAAMIEAMGAAAYEQLVVLCEKRVTDIVLAKLTEQANKETTTHGLASASSGIAAHAHPVNMQANYGHKHLLSPLSPLYKNSGA
jgi:hypothetical protein